MQKNSAKRPVYKYKVNIRVKIDNLSMEGIAVEYILNSIDPVINENNMNLIHI